MIISSDLQLATKHLKDGHVIAYPTEAVYGLGCDPFNKKAVLKLLTLKQRNIGKGLILIASAWSQIELLILPLSKPQLTELNRTWPGPVTWLLPASKYTPQWLRGEHHSIAIRLTNHPLAKALCETFKKPIVSTSANVAGELPAFDYQTVIRYFDEHIDFILQGEVGDLTRPTTIRDIMTGAIVRE